MLPERENLANVIRLQLDEAMDNGTRDLLAEITHKQPQIVEQLHQYCQINSGTTHLKGLARMRSLLIDTFSPLADEVRAIDFPPIPIIDMEGNATIQEIGSALFISKRPHLQRRVLLAGHMDTVYHEHHPFQHLTYLNKNQLNGPGVADMKGGLLVIAHALHTFEQMPEAATLGWDVVINADEEIGSPASAQLFAEIANNYQAGLIYEPAMDAEGTLAKNRRGSGKFTFVASGKAAHVGRAFNEGRNAICYLAELALAIHALNGQREGVTLNVGKIAGGEALNVVPDRATAKIDARISNDSDQVWVNTQFQNIIKTLQRDGFTLELYGNFGRPVKKVCRKTTALFERLIHIGKQLAVPINWQDSGGCCDGNNLAQYGLPVIDTLGVRGGYIHNAKEFILLDSLIERIALSALLLKDLAAGSLEEINR